MKALSPERLDALQEFVSIGVGRAAAILNEMLDAHILLNVPSVEVFSGTELRQQLIQRFNWHQKYSAVELGFMGGFSGTTKLIFPTESASTLVALLTGEDIDSPDLDAVKIGTLTEVGNIVINGVMGSISNVLHQRFDYLLPVYVEDTVEQLLLAHQTLTDQTVFMLAQARFEIAQLEIIGDVILIFEMTSFGALLGAIDDELSLSL